MLKVSEHLIKEQYSPLVKFLYKKIYTFFSVSSGYNQIANYFSSLPVSDSPRPRFNKEALEYSMQALLRIKELCENRGIDLHVGIFKQHSAPNYVNSIIEMIAKNINRLGIEYFFIESYNDNLTLQQFRVSYNDSHPSATAVEYIVNDIYQQIKD